MTPNDQLQALRERLGGAIRAEMKAQRLNTRSMVKLLGSWERVLSPKNARYGSTSIDACVENLLALGYDMARIAEIVKGERWD